MKTGGNRRICCWRSGWVRRKWRNNQCILKARVTGVSESYDVAALGGNSRCGMVRYNRPLFCCRPGGGRLRCGRSVGYEDGDIRACYYDRNHRTLCP